MNLIATFAEARALARGRVGLVPTMGFFHEAHLEMMRRARPDCDTLTVSLFVNPLQFGPGEDLDTYPRDLNRDTALAEAEGVDLLFAPGPGEMYPEPPVLSFDVGPIGTVLEGTARPGFFEGVVMAVAKLLAGLRPDAAYFGRKDAQQLAVVHRLAADLSFPVEIVETSTVREQDGLALSSRNTYLGSGQRAAAAALASGLLGAADAADAGERRAAELSREVAEAIEKEPEMDLEYAELVDASDVTPLAELDRPAFLAAAATIGGIRLIDNVFFDGPGLTADRGIRLARPSIIYEES